MSQIALIGAPVEAEGHPSDCQEPVGGQLSQSAPCSVTVNGIPVATTSTATMEFPSHAHSYEDDTCTDVASHSLSGLDNNSTVTVNGASVFTVSDGVAEDPISGGSVHITASGGNASISET